MKVKTFKENEHTCDDLMQALTDHVQELDFLCRATTKISKKNKFIVDSEKINLMCDLIIETVNNVRKGVKDE